MSATGHRMIDVSENKDHDAEFSGHVVKINLHFNRSQSASMTLTRNEASTLADLLDHYFTENPE